MLLTVYGINNIGKTTQCKMLTEALQEKGFKAYHLKYPNYEIQPSGPYLYEVMRNHSQTISEAELQMWMTINRFQFEPELRKIISENDIVIAEDYTETAIAWGAAKGLDPQWVETINQPLIKEDHSILIDGQRSTKSIEHGHIHENQDDLIQKVRTHYLQRASLKNWHVINRQERLEDTHNLILNHVLNILNAQ